ncbi:unnamed protein product [Rotaria magnacalcarata]|uniref:Cytosolic Fe-S cluster assembly factor NUBP1 homolog n=2 Tax=Rotaria magnacalcarata TaxID=392030 RepID=A0A815XDS4_9BILA|nr:unnamed protein product [Rotaria magnacalcarata]CAF1556394.1 unnamed protein product [Rotaria magnacalcarata]CAF2074284.1 unnamed protein product [Rotaria magnacalcarata]CAF2269232.1 unnamed protein product [Rotaria magnacalcarata]CAF3843079.1 unnamed protein product [Rotaria magnacalcarata]
MENQTNNDVPADAPHACPGTSSTLAGRVSACAGCPNQSVCSSGEPRRIDPAIVEIGQRLSSVKNIILVLSGKGGVGKTTVAVLLARALARNPQLRIALLDIDICGPSVPRALGVENEQVHSSGSGWSPVYVTENLCAMSVGFLLTSLEQAVIWKGPRKDNMIKQFLLDVDWGEGELDYLIVDTPPGTSDEHLSVVNYLKNVSSLSGCILVTTPQEISLQDVRKEVSFVKQTNINVLGIVENMSIFKCGKCHKESTIFPRHDGLKQLCETNNYELLSSIPIDPYIAKCCDDGEDLFELHSDSSTAKVYLNLAEKIQAKCQLKKE